MRARIVALILAAAVLGGPTAASAAETEDPDRMTEFGAASDEAEAAEAGDYQAMLRVCDRRLDSCKTDAVGVPYLAGAYMALWGILIVFLVLVRRGQRRLEVELADLEARLREAEEGRP
ncbi:MAG: hypothetical protein ACQEXJ_07040 [Myxococcota bacterium]